MLALPEQGMAWSVNTHNVDLSILCDWIEAAAFFSEEEVSQSDIVDILLENEVYASQDFASVIVDTAWRVLRSRATQHGAPDLIVDRDSIQRSRSWEESPGYAFCLMLACSAYLYPEWARRYGYDHAIQGSLFERLAKESFVQMLPGWVVRRVGWAPDNPIRLKDAVQGIIDDLHEVASSEVDLHVDAHANELGLDLLAYRRFADSHASFPIVMVQCASGKDWLRKRKTPDLDIWEKVISFNSRPMRAFAMPYAFTDGSQFRKEAAAVRGLFLDRYRLLLPSPESGPNWLPDELNDELREWIRPRIESLPRENQ